GAASLVEVLRRRPPGIVKRGRGILASGNQVGNDNPGSRPVGDSPGVETGGDVESGSLVRGRPDIGNSIGRIIVLVGPAPDHVADLESLPRPVLQFQEKPGNVAFLPRVEMRSEDDEKRAVGISAGTDRMRRLSGRDEYPLRS